jgi:site-specific recombinase XerD
LTREAFVAISVADVDTCMKNRAGSMRRVSIKLVTTNLRSFLRWLHAMGRTPRNLSKVVVAPVLYALESIPSALRPQDVGKILSMARQDRTPKGIRDFAILTLLANYGVRAGEIASRVDKSFWHVPLTTLGDGTLAVSLSRNESKQPLNPWAFSFEEAAEAEG